MKGVKGVKLRLSLYPNISRKLQTVKASTGCFKFDMNLKCSYKCKSASKNISISKILHFW